MLLWISLEYMVGLHDKLSDLYAYITPFSISIIIFCCYRAYREKLRTQPSEIPFSQLFIAGFLLALFAAILTVPVQLIFHSLINPDFFQSMIDNAGHKAMAMGEDKEAAKQAFARLFNLPMFMFLYSTITFVVGTIVAMVLAWQMNTSKD